MHTLTAKKRIGYAGFTLIELMIVIAIIGILAAVAIPNFMRARSKSQYTACFEQLSHVKTGIESYLSENNDLANPVALDAAGDLVCNHILAGFQTADDCKGVVVQRVDAVCLKGTFTVAAVANAKGVMTNYDIKGQANDRTNCNICVTELRGTPSSYDTCGAAYDCQHAN